MSHNDTKIASGNPCETQSVDHIQHPIILRFQNRLSQPYFIGRGLRAMRELLGDFLEFIVIPKLQKLKRDADFRNAAMENRIVPWQWEPETMAERVSRISQNPRGLVVAH